MRWKTPSFWRHNNILAYLLWPLSIQYYLFCIILKLIKKHPADKGKLPLICVGNVVMGGGGKTPTAIALCQLLKTIGYRPAFISKGYGGLLSKGDALQVTGQHSAEQVGDEPLLLLEYAPVFIASQRVKAVKLAEQSSDVDILIMDDGLQNGTVVKHLSLLVVHGGYGIGNGLLFPAGPLREPFSEAFERVQATIIIGEDKAQITPLIESKSFFHASLAVSSGELPSKKERYVAFAGIAHPSHFFSFLETAGYFLEETVAFPDHYPYKKSDIVQLQALAKTKDAILITTEKDWVRLSPEMKEKVLCLPVMLHLAECEKLKTWLNDYIKKQIA